MSAVGFERSTPVLKVLVVVSSSVMVKAKNKENAKETILMFVPRFLTIGS